MKVKLKIDIGNLKKGDVVDVSPFLGTKLIKNSEAEPLEKAVKETKKIAKDGID